MEESAESSRSSKPRNELWGAAGLYLLALGGGVLIGPGVAVVCVVLGTVLVVVAAAGADPVQRAVPTLGRLPLIEDRGYIAAVRTEATSGDDKTDLRDFGDEALLLADEIDAFATQRSEGEPADPRPSEGDDYIFGREPPPEIARYRAETKELYERQFAARSHHLLVEFLRLNVLRPRINYGYFDDPGDAHAMAKVAEALRKGGRRLGAEAPPSSTETDAVQPTGDVRLAIQELIHAGYSAAEDVRTYFSGAVKTQVVATWTDEAVQVLRARVSGAVALRFLQVANGNGPDALAARVRFLEDLAGSVEP